MAEQIGLGLPVQSSEGIDEFYISDCNTMAVNLLEDWKNWPNLKHTLSGPPASGKTHLGRIWAKQVSANYTCLLYTSPSPRDLSTSRMPSSA